jgi:hypothetical protein
VKYVRASDGQGTQTLELELSLMQTTKKPFTEEKTEEKTTNKHKPTHTHTHTDGLSLQSNKKQNTGLLQRIPSEKIVHLLKHHRELLLQGGTLEKTKEGRSSCERRRR